MSEVLHKLPEKIWNLSLHRTSMIIWVTTVLYGPEVFRGLGIQRAGCMLVTELTLSYINLGYIGIAYPCYGDLKFKSLNTCQSSLN